MGIRFKGAIHTLLLPVFASHFGTKNRMNRAQLGENKLGLRLYPDYAYSLGASLQKLDSLKICQLVPMWASDIGILRGLLHENLFSISMGEARDCHLDGVGYSQPEPG